MDLHNPLINCIFHIHSFYLSEIQQNIYFFLVGDSTQLLSSLTRYNRYKRFCHELCFLDPGSHKRNICNYRGSVVDNYYYRPIFSQCEIILFFVISQTRDDLLFCIPNTNNVRAQCVGFHLRDDPLHEVLNLVHEVFST